MTLTMMFSGSVLFFISCMMYYCKMMVFFLALISLVTSMNAMVIDDNKDRFDGATGSLMYQRLKRESLGSCSSPMNFLCKDGTCVESHKSCDGNIDCPDGSDETHHLCGRTRCPNYLFRCTYGACVDGTAACNGVKECADNSDELQPKCSNKTLIRGTQFSCDDGGLVDMFVQCDGVRDCQDGSDETIRACAGVVCPSHLFQCAYGACVDEGAECNDIDDCADGSDESDLLCNRAVPRTTITTTTATTPISSTETPKTTCVIPSPPKHGRLRVHGPKNVVPGMVENVVYFNVTCDPGYKLVGDSNVFCYYGYWSVDEFPSCLKACKVERSQSVVYRCLINDVTGTEGTRRCEDLEVEGTVVQPECRQPNYYSPIELSYMYCIDGQWNHVPKCFPECGTMTPKGVPLIAGGTPAERGEVPWHAGIYWKNSTSRTQICGGSLISDNIIISAAHCFWHEQLKQLPASRYSAAVGKVFREWSHPHDDVYSQKSDVKDVYISHYFFGAELNYQHDLALVIVESPFVYRTYVRPVCLDFNEEFNDRQLANGKVGKVAGWGLTSGLKGSESDFLNVLDMPFVPFETCVRVTSPVFIEFISGDKICAGYGNGTAVCKGDSGGGLAFPEEVQGRVRYFLRGVVSTSPPALDGARCNLFALTSFEPVLKHARLIKRYWFL